jgi:hypothetical protein
MVGELRLFQDAKIQPRLREIINENTQSGRISTMKMPKVMDFLGMRAAPLSNRSPIILYLPWF